MRIAVMGTGGVGGYFGARLAEAGHDVAFIARGAQLAALRQNGLRVEGDAGSLRVRCSRALPAAVLFQCHQRCGARTR